MSSSIVCDSKTAASAESDKLPLDWKRVRVADIALAIQYGHTSSAVSQDYGPRFLRITDIQDGQVDWDTVPSCDIGPADVQKYLLADGDIVFARTGATTGKSFLISTCPQAVFASYLIRLRMGPQVLPRYVHAFFQSSDYWRQIEVSKRLQRAADAGNADAKEAVENLRSIPR